MTTHHRQEMWAPLGDVGYMRAVASVISVDYEAAGCVYSQPVIRFQVDCTGDIKAFEVLRDALAEQVVIFLRQLDADNFFGHSKAP